MPGAPISDEDDDNFSPVETPLAVHHRYILSAAQRCIDTHSGRLMLFLPPGSAKSTYGSIIVPAFAMGRTPGFRVIGVSYGSDLARKMGRKTRAVVRQPAYNALFDAGVSAESAAADEWALTNGSEYMSGGILSGITGNRADFIPIDDPIKGRQDADSPQIRKRTLEAYEDDVLTRLKPGGSVMIIQTRWHQSDLAGAILPENYNGESGLIECRDGKTWEVVCIPAQAERSDDPLGRAPGEYLWTEWFDEAHWSTFKRSARTWSSLYQQRPAPEEGAILKREWLRPYFLADRPAKETLRIYGASDYAVTASGGDYTVHVIVGIDALGRLWLLDLWREQSSSDKWVESFCDLVLKWRPVAWAEETGQIRAGVGPFLDRRIRERKAFVWREKFPTRGDKAVRAQSMIGRMALDGLYVPVDAPWYEAFVSELMSFPAGTNDDQVDAIGLIGQLLDRIIAPMGEQPEIKSDRKHVFTADEDGNLQSSMSIKDIVLDKQKRRTMDMDGTDD